MYHILVVDDESRIRTLIRKYAEFEGHTVTEAGDGMEAVNLCRTQTFDLDHHGHHDAGAGRLFGLPGDPEDQPDAHHHAVGTRGGV